MKKITTFALLLTILFALPCSSKNTNRGLFWKIEKNGYTSYILGSIHVAKKDIYPLSENINTAFEKSSNLVVEVNVNNINPVTIRKIFIEKGMLKTGNLRDRISPKLYEFIAHEFAKYNYLESQYIGMKPWLAAITLTQLNLQTMGYNNKLGIDLHFLSKGSGKKIFELETMELQMKLFGEMDKKIEVLFLKYSLAEMKNLKELMRNLYYLWESGDSKGMNLLLSKTYRERKDLAPLFTKLIKKRNISMAKSIDKIIVSNQIKSSFIVVGAAHLVGKTGIVNLLKKKGYKLTQQ